MNTKLPLFPLGQCCMTPGISELVEQYNFPIAEYLYRHQSGDWGDLGQEDKRANNDAIADGTRLLSAYHFRPEPSISIKIWIITEADRSVTTLLLPSEY